MRIILFKIKSMYLEYKIFIYLYDTTWIKIKNLHLDIFLKLLKTGLHSISRFLKFLCKITESYFVKQFHVIVERGIKSYLPILEQSALHKQFCSILVKLKLLTYIYLKSAKIYLPRQPDCYTLQVHVFLITLPLFKFL